MITSFHSGETGIKLSIENYDLRKTNVRYKAVINEDQLAVLHLQTVDTEDSSDVSQLSLCPGVPESELQDVVSQLLINNLGQIIIEAVDDKVVFRSRSCQLLCNQEEEEEEGGVCQFCRILLRDLKIDLTQFKDENPPCVNVKPSFEEVQNIDDYNLSNDNFSENGSDTNTAREAESEAVVESKKVEPTVIRIMKRKLSETEEGNMKKVKRQSKHYYCDQCDFQATTRVGVRQHVKNKHEGIRYNCDQCDKQFTKKINLQNHIDSVHSGVKHQCDQCGQQFKHKLTLQHHTKFKHEGIHYQCDQCAYSTATKDRLKIHLTTVHSQLKPYLCDQCDFKTATKGSLLAHIQCRHEGVRHPCDRCQFQATTPSALYRHVKAKHEGVRYPCDQCDYRASSKALLKNHIAIKHDGITFPCGHCPHQASCAKNLAKHIKSKHNYE